MAGQVSPGVVIKERDLTNARIDNTIDNVGAIAGRLVNGRHGPSGDVGGVPDAVGPDVQAYRHVVHVGQNTVADLQVDAGRSVLLRHDRP